MADEKLGMRGTLALIDSIYKLIGGANATGALAAGVAFHAFASKPEMQGSIKIAAALFLAGVLGFVMSYTSFVFASFDLYRGAGGEEFIEKMFGSVKTHEQYTKTGRRHLAFSVLLAIASYACFLFGLARALTLSMSA